MRFHYSYSNWQHLATLNNRAMGLLALGYCFKEGYRFTTLKNERYLSRFDLVMSN